MLGSMSKNSHFKKNQTVSTIEKKIFFFTLFWWVKRLIKTSLLLGDESYLESSMIKMSKDKMSNFFKPNLT